MTSFRYASLFAFIAVFMFVSGLIPAGQIRMVFFPEIPTDTIVVSYKAVSGLSTDRLFAEADRIEQVARETDQALSKQTNRMSPLIVRLETIAMEGGEVLITAELAPRSTRRVGTAELARRWKERVGPVEGVDKLDFASSWEGEEDLRISLVSDDRIQLKQASEDLVQYLSKIKGVSDLRNSLKTGRAQVRLELHNGAKSMGLTISDLASQLYGGLSGYEVQRIQREEDEVKVRVRLPLSERGDLLALRDLNIRTAKGHVVSLSDVADIIPDYAEDSITRVNYQQVAVITADTDKSLTSGAEIVKSLEQQYFQKLKIQHPGLTVRVGGEVQEENKAMKGFAIAFSLSIIAIYVLLAVPLKSYLQPLIIMSAIPFGVVGAIVGHWMNGIPISVLSLTGMLALSGVVVNDSLLLLTAYNRNREDGASVYRSLIQAGRSRFRAVVLTSVTTYAGLAPLIMETSEQAQFLIPAAISLGYGILFATAITLVLIPVLIFIVEDIKRLVCQTPLLPPIPH